MNDNERRLVERLGCDPDEIAKIEVDIEFFANTPPGTGLILLTLGALHRKVDKLMADLSALQTAVDGLVAVEGAAAEELVALKDEVAQLQAGTITQEQIDSITNKVTGVATALTQATEAAKAEEPAPPAPAPEGEPPAEPPAEGGETPAPAPEGEPAPEPTPPASPEEPPAGEPPAGEPA